jgi:2,4-didehydro-3-deoxy-L-rhamnonate hydrolase
MKLFRFGSEGNERPAVLRSNGQRIDVSSAVSDYNEAWFASGGIEELRKLLNSREAGWPDVDPDARLGPCIARPSKIICIGLNYARHAAESNMDPPKEPVIFLKATSSLAGPYDTVVMPKGSKKTDWEVELAVIIGKKATYVRESDATDYVAGYCVHNDYSERSFQLERGGQWTKGKSCDTFAPLGPIFVTKDEIPDPHNLPLWLKVNGIMRQKSSTSDLIFKIPTLVSYLSQFMSLLPGDIISTGTPEGVGLGLNPPQYLKDGDVVELGIEGLGTSQQRIAAYRESTVRTASL